MTRTTALGIASLALITACTVDLADEPLPPTSGPGGGGGAGGSGGSTTSAGVTCVSNQQCTDDSAGLPAICAPGGCQEVLSAECSTVLGDVTDDDGILLGAIVPLTGPSSNVGVAMTDGMQLAVDEIRDGGDVPGAGDPRPLAIVVCDEEGNLTAAIDHLTSDLGVDAVVGPVGASNVLAALPQTTAAGALALAPLDAPAEVLSLADDGLHWGVRGITGRLGRAYPALVQELEGHLDAQPNPPGELRVAVVSGASPAIQMEATSIIDDLVFNGVSAQDNMTAGRFLYLATDGTSWGPTTADLVDFEPDVVLAFQTEPSFAELMPAVADALAPQGVAPFWVVDWLDPNLTAQVGAASTDLAARVLSVTAPDVTSRSLYQAFSIRFTASTGAAPTVDAASAYDAVYLTTFAHVAALPAPAEDGSALATGLTDLTPLGASPISAAVDVGPQDLASAWSALAAGGGVDVELTTGPWTADPADGFPRREGGVQCFDGTGGSVVTAPTGWTWDGTTLSGGYDFSCP